jgi:uncharacterized membrane protein YkgB
MGNERVTSVLKLLIIDEDEGYLRLREEALRQPDLHILKASNGTIAFSQALGLMIASVGVGPLIDDQGK